ncbi:substrate-binding periplasmic protein [Pseudoduganella aquatica]|uniref:substrate-binding periplasmic protein n=1 Tax=Pseudoduganella aquatica TaxID=2660641 RepID=UPI001E29C77E|nr:transporter substrate-binding domain-containing protein [Pseudoduganella aquatica]
MKKIRLCALALLAVSSAPPPCNAAPALTLQIVQRAPYLMVGPGKQMSGISVAPTVAAFRHAGIDVAWEEVPALRQLQRLRANQEKVCSVGWYKTPERERYAKFSDPVSQDSPWAAFAFRGYTPPPSASVRAIFSDPGTKILLKQGFVYGDYLDQAISTMTAQRMDTNGDMHQLFKMIAAGRADISFAPLEEIRYHLDQGSISRASIRIIEFPEMPAGYPRRLMCSKRVDDDLLRRFNAALGENERAMLRKRSTSKKK